MLTFAGAIEVARSPQSRPHAAFSEFLQVYG